MKRVLLPCILSIMVIFPYHGFAPDREVKIKNEVIGIDKNNIVDHIQWESPSIVLPKTEIYHYELLDVYVYNAPGVDPDSLFMSVYQNDRIKQSVGGEYRIPFRKQQKGSKAVYLPDWNEREGRYEIRIYYNEKQVSTSERLYFNLKRRPLPRLEKGMSIVDLEMNVSIKQRSFVDPQGNPADYSAILEWARFMQAEMLWILAGETTSFQSQPNKYEVWDRGPLENLKLLKNMAPRYEIGIGAYIMSFYVPGSFGIPQRYEPGLGYNSANGTLYRSKHISLGCERRIQDIVELVKKFQDDPHIEYIGFDFIRTGRADGYELGPLVVEETNIMTPRNWDYFSEEQKILWFARQIEVEKNPLIIEKWRWWRAHRVAEIVKRAIIEAGVTKPVWVYTLGWDHGREHGQDPVMFFDAGVSIDAVMLYEASRLQFERLLKQWNRYIHDGEGNIFVGNCVDSTLLDSESLSPPEEYYRRNVEGYRGLIRGGLASGIFLHDISRGMWGRRGGFSFKDYALSHVSSVYDLREDLQDLELSMDVSIQDYERTVQGKTTINGYIQLKNNGIMPLNNINIAFLPHENKETIVYLYKDTALHSNVIDIERFELFAAERIGFTINHMDYSHIKKIRFKVDIGKDTDYYITRLVSMD